MVVQHNIMALNSYNKLSSNNSAVGKNLEKLSSGYKINRAGDDAAGLAISEKMRAQITGLERATSNAQDGISLVQTAEGALTEVHSMLNRMVELATQSANGTYEDADRQNLQKEITSLNEEINRIAKETNFNGLKLLDGSMTAGKMTEGAAIDLSLPAAKTVASGGAVGTDTIVHESGAKAQKTVFKVDLRDYQFEVKNADNTFKLTVGGVDIELTAAQAGTATANVGDMIAGKDLAAALATKTATTPFKITSGGDDIEFDVTNDNGVLTFTQKEDYEVGQTAITGEIAVVAAPDGTGTPANGGILNSGALVITSGVAPTASQLASTTFTLDAGKMKDGNVLTIGDQQFVFKVGKDSTVEAGDGQTLIDLTKYEDANAPGQIAAAKLDLALDDLTVAAEGNKVFDVGHGAAGKITLTELGTNDVSEYDTTSKEAIEKLVKLNGRGVMSAEEAKKQPLSLQIGDTASQRISVSIVSMGTKNLGIDGVNISTESGATAAIDLVKTAINTVSAQRADLGAIQNRLEHTITNLETTTENLTSAESRIRDTDMAKEMMAYTKNNVLSQAAQAMLAQSNQQPQQVLQLLQ